MKSRRIILLAGLSIALALAGLVAACGGGGGGTTADGGIGGTGISVGAISGFGSIYVNGVEFEIEDTTELIIDDMTISGSADDKQSKLALNQVVRVEGEFGDDGVSGTATSIEVDSLLEGPVTAAVNTTAKAFEVVGQFVFYDGSTLFEDSGGGSITPDQLAVDNVVEVYGFPDASLQIKATRVERKSPTFTPGTDVIEVWGKVSNLDTTQMIFDINNLEVHYSVATTFDNGSMSDLANNRFVEVKGDDDPMVNGLDADKIEFENPFSGNDGDLLEIEGNISSVTTSTDFVVNGVVRVDASGAVFENGRKTDVRVDVEVEVKGTIENRSGESVLVAREVEFEVEDDARIEAFVDSIDAAANTLNVLGIMVEYSDNTLDTEFEDKSGAPAIGTVDGLDPSNNDWVRVEATIDSSGNLFASRIERDNDDADDTRVILKGPASDTPSSIPALDRSPSSGLTLSKARVWNTGWVRTPPSTGQLSLTI
jgi:hypothetical protein